MAGIRRGVEGVGRGIADENVATACLQRLGRRANAEWSKHDALGLFCDMDKRQARPDGRAERVAVLERWCFRAESHA